MISGYRMIAICQIVSNLLKLNDPRSLAILVHLCLTLLAFLIIDQEAIKITQFLQNEIEYTRTVYPDTLCLSELCVNINHAIIVPSRTGPSVSHWFPIQGSKGLSNTQHKTFKGYRTCTPGMTWIVPAKSRGTCTASC